MDTKKEDQVMNSEIESEKNYWKECINENKYQVGYLNKDDRLKNKTSISADYKEVVVDWPTPKNWTLTTDEVRQKARAIIGKCL